MIPAKVLGNNWVECTDTLRNKIYYANLHSKETTWDFPEELLADSDLVNHSEHWIEAMDLQHHKKYYYNRITKESKWDKPICLAIQPSHAIADIVVASTAPVVNSGSKKASMLSALKSMKTESENEAASISSTATKETSRREQNVVCTDREEQSYVEQLLYAVAISTEALFDMSSPERSLFNYGKLNFATATSGIFKRKISVEKMLEWSKKGISNPLHNMQGEMMTEAVQFSKNIRGFMGDRASTKSLAEHADKIIKVLLLSSQELRDELFCQLCKQLNKNPSKQSAIKGWQLFLISLTSAAPNNELMISLIDFFRQFIEGEDKDIASFAEDTLHKCYIATQLHGSRVERPSAVEVASIMSVSDFGFVTPFPSATSSLVFILICIPGKPNADSHMVSRWRVRDREVRQLDGGERAGAHHCARAGRAGPQVLRTLRGTGLWRRKVRTIIWRTAALP